MVLVGTLSSAAYCTLVMSPDGVGGNTELPVYCTLVMSLDGVGGNTELPCLLCISYIS